MITPEDVSRITDDVQFRRFIDGLLQAEKRRIVAGGSVEILTKDNTRDDGVDGWATLDLRGVQNASPLFPHQNVFYQLKLNTSPASLRDSLNKPGPKARIGAHVKSGGHYVVVVAAALTLPQEDDGRQAVLDGLGLAPLHLAQIRMVSAAVLCAATRPHLDLYVRLGLPDLGEAETLDEWNYRLLRAFHTPFEPDAETKALAEAIRAALANQNPLFCMVGASGSGKSRTIYEAVRVEAGAPTVYFATPALLFDSKLLAWLKRQPNPAVVVVDGCDTIALRELHSRLMPGKSTVIAICEGARAPPGTPRYDWKGPTETALERILAKSCPKLTEAERKWVVHVCGRNPLMALHLGTKLQETPAGERHKVLSMHEEERAVLLIPDGTEKLAMHIALFDRVGYRGDVADEFNDLAKYIGLQPEDARALVEQLGAPELIQGQKYITLRPVILRAHLLRRFIQLRGGTPTDLAAAIIALRQALPAMPVDERIMGGLALAITTTNQPDLANAVVGSAGLFATMEDLDQRAATFRLQALAEGAPHQVLAMLERLLGQESAEGLKGLKQGRRGVVPALETIATEADLFHRAARILLALAIHENERWSNNASGTFAELFSPAIGNMAPTNASGKQRIHFLEKASQDPQYWSLVANALRQLFSVHHVRSVSSNPTSRGNLPGWTPQTWGEVHEYVAAGWDLAARLFGSSEAIADAAHENIRNLYGYRSLRPRLTSWLEQKAVREEDARALDAVADILAYDAEGLKDDVAPLKAIMDKVLSSGLRGGLMRYVVISPVHDEISQSREESLENILEGIAKQAVSEAEPQATVDFLIARKASRGNRLAFFIGKHDAGAKWWTSLARDIRYEVPYLLGRRQADPASFDQLVGSVPNTAAGCQALASSLRDARDVGRLVKAIKEHPDHASNMRVWPTQLDVQSRSALVEILVAMPHHAPRRLGLETALLYGAEKNQLTMTRSAVLAALACNPGDDNDIRDLSLYSWVRLGIAMVIAFPDTIEVILDRIEDLARGRGLQHAEELARLVQECARHDFTATEQRVRQWLLLGGMQRVVAALVEPDQRDHGVRPLGEERLAGMLMTMPPRDAVSAVNLIHFSWPGNAASAEQIETSAIARLYDKFKDVPGIDSAVFNSLSRGSFGDPADADRQTAEAYLQMSLKIPLHPFATWLAKEAENRRRTAEWWDERREDEGWG